LNKEDFIEKFKNDPNFPELQNLKDIQEDAILDAIKLTLNQLDQKGIEKKVRLKKKKEAKKIIFFLLIGWNRT